MSGREKDVICSACSWQGYTDEETADGRCPECGGRLDAIVRPVFESEGRAYQARQLQQSQQERLVTITFRITSRDFSARGPALERSLILAAERATQAFAAPGFGVGPYSANTVGVPDASGVHEHEGHPLEGAYHEHVYQDGPHEHPNLGLGAIRTAIAGTEPAIAETEQQISAERSIL